MTIGRKNRTGEGERSEKWEVGMRGREKERVKFGRDGMGRKGNSVSGKGIWESRKGVHPDE
jgi:hypothetical protein